MEQERNWCILMVLEIKRKIILKLIVESKMKLNSKLKVFKLLSLGVDMGIPELNSLILEYPFRLKHIKTS